MVLCYNRIRGDKMRVLILGQKGLLGRNLAFCFKRDGHTVVNAKDYDLTDATAFDAIMNGLVPDVVINCTRSETVLDAVIIDANALRSCEIFHEVSERRPRYIHIASTVLMGDFCYSTSYYKMKRATCDFIEAYDGSVPTTVVYPASILPDNYEPDRWVFRCLAGENLEPRRVCTTDMVYESICTAIDSGSKFKLVSTQDEITSREVREGVKDERIEKQLEVLRKWIK